jgi:hypothetical protein
MNSSSIDAAIQETLSISWVHTILVILLFLAKAFGVGKKLKTHFGSAEDPLDTIQGQLGLIGKKMEEVETIVQFKQGQEPPLVYRDDDFARETLVDLDFLKKEQEHNRRAIRRLELKVNSEPSD